MSGSVQTAVVPNKNDMGAAAQQAYQYVRALYKGTIKSSNKIYTTSNDTPNVENSLAQPGAWTAKHDTRNANQALANAQVTLWRDWIEKSGHGYLADGKEKSHALAGTYGTDVCVAGNCHEMACMAMYYADWLRGQGWRVFGIWHVGIADPGDHAFAVIGPVFAPGAKNVQELRGVQGEAWAIDPWLGVCCELQKYQSAFTYKSIKWTQEGKRIWLKNSSFSGWTAAASPEYTKGFLTGPLSFTGKF